MSEVFREIYNSFSVVFLRSVYYVFMLFSLLQYPRGHLCPRLNTCSSSGFSELRKLKGSKMKSLARWMDWRVFREKKSEELVRKCFFFSRGISLCNVSWLFRPCVCQSIVMLWWCYPESRDGENLGGMSLVSPVLVLTPSEEKNERYSRKKGETTIFLTRSFYLIFNPNICPQLLFFVPIVVESCSNFWEGIKAIYWQFFCGV